MPLQLDDLIDAGSYEHIRAELLEAVIAIRRPRRCSLGALSLVFESRDTVLFQIHEVLRAEGDWSRARCLRELDEYGCLVPDRQSLAATVMVTGGAPADGAAFVAALAAGRPVLALDIAGVPAVAALAAPPLSVHNPVQYIRFRLDAEQARRLAGGEVAARLQLETPGGRLTGPDLAGALAGLLADRGPTLWAGQLSAPPSDPDGDQLNLSGW